MNKKESEFVSEGRLGLMRKLRLTGENGHRLSALGFQNVGWGLWIAPAPSFHPIAHPIATQKAKNR
jgi:hypothetical protein